MKYVRTANSVLLNDIEDDKYYEWLLTEPVPSDVVAEADTIEELCDFVDIQYKDGSWEFYPYEKEFRLKILFNKAKQVFYGIRTRKGLIYVAKGNEEGEPELLWKNV